MKQWTVDDVMTRDVVTVRTEMSYRELVDLLAARGVSALPVVDDFHRVLGVVSEADLLHKIEFPGDDARPRFFEWAGRKRDRAKAHAGTAAELMTAPAVTVSSGTTLSAAAKLLDHENVKRLPVVDHLGRLVGIVSRSDLLTVYLRPDHQIHRDVIDEALKSLTWLDPLKIKAEVREGIVTLSGEVGRKSTVSIVTYMVSTVPGVIDVVSHLTYSYDDTAVAATTGL